MRYENVNYQETPEGDIVPDYRAGHGNQPGYPGSDDIQPDYFYDKHASASKREEFEVAPKQAGELGTLVAEEYMKNPDKFGSDWPSIDMQKAASHIDGRAEIPQSVRDVRSKLKNSSPANSAKNATPKYIKSREEVLGRGE